MRFSSKHEKHITAFSKIPRIPPSLHFKVMKRRGLTLHSARVGLHYRALAYEDGDSLYWFWIGPHAEYDHLLDRL